MDRRERLEAALAFREPDRPPHFELEFQIAREAFGLDYPPEKLWFGSEAERREAWRRAAEISRRILESYRWDALPVISGHHDYGYYAFLRGELGGEAPLAGMIWHSTLSIETVEDWPAFAEQLFLRPGELHRRARALMDAALQRARRLCDAGCELLIVPSDIAWNQGPFMEPERMRELVFAYLAELVDFAREQGLPLIFHTDGDLRPIMDLILELGPAALQSIDPIAGMELGEIKEMTRGKVALMGNVDCGALHAGPREAVEDSARRALDLGPPGGGYIFSSSNTIFQGVPLEHYEAMLGVYRERYPLPD